MKIKIKDRRFFFCEPVITLHTCEPYITICIDWLTEQSDHIDEAEFWLVGERNGWTWIYVRYAQDYYTPQDESDMNNYWWYGLFRTADTPNDVWHHYLRDASQEDWTWLQEKGGNEDEI